MLINRLKLIFYSICATTVGSLCQLPKALGTSNHKCDDEWATIAGDCELASYKWLHWGPLSAFFVTIMIGLNASILHVSWWDITAVGGFLDLMVFFLWNYLVLTNLNMACKLGGGYIKLGWHPTDKKDWKMFRYCHRCMGFKVPRSHHCSKCARCVMLMDHHCPWINTCVGQRNQFRFIRFLFFAVVGCTHAAIIMTSCLYQVVTFIIDSKHHYEPPELPINSIYLFISAVLAVGMAYGVVIAVGVLLLIQLRSVYLNTTGIENLLYNDEQSNGSALGHQWTSKNGEIRSRSKVE